MHYELQSVESSLRDIARGYPIRKLVCMGCGRTHPNLAKQCHPCHNNDLIPKYCTTQYRVAEYFEALRRAELWPSLEPFRSFAASDLAFRVACAKTDLRHDCAAGTWCPLKLELEALDKRIHAILDGVTGLDLCSLHQDPVTPQN